MKKTDKEAYQSALCTVVEGISLANRLNNRPKMIHLNKVKDELLSQLTPHGKSKKS
jgi:hypothetical protein